MRLVLEEAKQRLGYTDEDLEEPEVGTSSCSLLVYPLPPDIKAEDLMICFSTFGTVVSTSVLGHVTMSSSEEASRSVQGLHEKDLNGSQISVEKTDMFTSHRERLQHDEKSFLRKLKKKVDDGNQNDPRSGDNSVEKNVVTELFDEVLEQKKSRSELERRESIQSEEDSSSK